MSKKHFIALADAIRAHNLMPIYPGQQWFSDDQIETLADFCQSQNGNFKRDRWIGYIKGENGPNGGAR